MNDIIKSGNRIKHNAFTLAEVLITLVVIGVVAAITIPAVVQNTQDKEYNAMRQKVRTSIGEAFRLISINEENGDNLTTEEFTKTVLPRYLKIMKDCDNASECDFPTKVTRPDGSKLNTIPTTMRTITSPYGVTVESHIHGQYGTYTTTNPTTQRYNNAHFFQTMDGISVMYFYNPYCVFNAKERPYYWDATSAKSEIVRQYSLDTACFWGVYDMNGLKAPNRVGKDIGLFGTFYNGKNAVAHAILPSFGEEKATAELTGGSDHWLRANDYCNTLDGGKKYRLPDVNELSLIFLNRKFVTDTNDNKWFWSGSALPGFAYMRLVHFVAGDRSWHGRTSSNHYVRCVRMDTSG